MSRHHLFSYAWSPRPVSARLPASAKVSGSSARIARNADIEASTVAQDGWRAGTSLTRAVLWIGVAFALCELMTACVSDVCPRDQIMIEETCLPAAVATEEVQNRTNLRATQAAEEADGGTPTGE
jgi:hypothetical protein